MYESYWQLSRTPFDNDADGAFFYRSDAHQAVLLKLRYLVEHHKGLGLLAGAGGTGKTFLALQLQRELAETHGPFVHLVFPQMSAAELLAFLAVELGAAESRVGNETGGIDRTIREIGTLLGKFADEGKHPVIFVDEAHLIDDPQIFQALRLLLNLHPQRQTPFSLILLGQPELLSTVRRIGQLEERLAFSCVLRPLSATETEEYVASRLETAGSRRRIFHRDALDALFQLSAGIPRRINRICDMALLVGYADDSQTITADQIEAVCEELTVAVAD